MHIEAFQPQSAQTLKFSVHRLRKRWWSTVMSMSVCLSLCPRAYLWNHTCDLYQFFWTCCLWPWLGPPSAGWRNPKGKAQFWGLSGPFKCTGNLRCSHSCCVCCKRDYSIANNVMQQKRSFSMPGSQIGIWKILSAGDEAYRPGWEWWKCTARVKSDIYDCLVFLIHVTMDKNLPGWLLTAVLQYF